MTNRLTSPARLDERRSDRVVRSRLSLLLLVSTVGHSVGLSAWLL